MRPSCGGLALGIVLISLFLLGGRESTTALLPSAPMPVGKVGELKPRAELVGAADDVNELLDRLVEALTEKDSEALHRLRVSREEYQNIIIPGTVEPGQPDRQVSERPKQYFWEMLDTKSRYFGDVLMQRYGGRRYVSRTVRYSEEPRVYSRYRASGEVHLNLTGEDETIYQLRTGWIAEVAGKYKFIGFEFDD